MSNFVAEEISFAKRHGIKVPKRCFFEPEFVFNFRISPWKEHIAKVMNKYSEAVRVYEKNVKEARSYVYLVNYVGEDIFSYIPDLQIDFSSNDLIEEIEHAIQKQKQVNLLALCTFAGSIALKVTDKFFYEIISNMPKNKTVIVIRTKNTISTTSTAELKFNEELSYLKSKLPEELRKEGRRSCYFNSSSVIVNYAFVPNAFTDTELKEEIKTLSPATFGTPSLLAKSLLESQVEYF